MSLSRFRSRSRSAAAWTTSPSLTSRLTTSPEAMFSPRSGSLNSGHGGKCQLSVVGCQLSVAAFVSGCFGRAGRPANAHEANGSDFSGSISRSRIAAAILPRSTLVAVGQSRRARRRRCIPRRPRKTAAKPSGIRSARSRRSPIRTIRREPRGQAARARPAHSRRPRRTGLLFRQSLARNTISAASRSDGAYSSGGRPGRRGAAPCSWSRSRRRSTRHTSRPGSSAPLHFAQDRPAAEELHARRFLTRLDRVETCRCRGRSLPRRRRASKASCSFRCRS